jgi:hypothetical protein
MPPADVVNHLLAAQRELVTNPERALAFLAEQCGVDLRRLAGGQQDNGAELQRRVDQALRARDDEWRQFLQARDTEAAQAQKMEADRQIKEARDRADKARRNSEINVRGDVINSRAPQSMDDTIAEAARRFYRQ